MSISRQTIIEADCEPEDPDDYPEFSMNAVIERPGPGAEFTQPRASIWRNGSAVGFDNIEDPDLLRAWAKMLKETASELEREQKIRRAVMQAQADRDPSEHSRHERLE